MVSQARLNLNWNGCEDNLKDALKSMREKEEFSDVTLVADDGKQVKASKVILSRGSSFFDRILRDNPHLYSHIYLVDVPYKHLLSVMDFLYTGDAIIRQGDIKQFLEIAEDSFRIKIEGAGVILPDQPIPKNVNPLQNQISLEDHTPEKRKPYLSKTISAPFKGDIAAEVQVTQNNGYSSQIQLSAEKQAQKIDGNSLLDFLAEKHAKKKCFHPNAPNQPQVVTGGQATRKNISSPQYQPPSKGHSDVRKLGQEFVHNVSPPLSNNTFPNTKRQDDTGIVKVEVPVGDANDYNVHYVSNDQGDQYISEMTHLERVFRNNANNYQDVRGQNQAMDQVENRMIPKEEPFDTSDNCDIVHSKAVGSEESGCTIPVGGKQNQKIKECSVKLIKMNIKLREEVSRQSRRESKRKYKDQSKYDNSVSETVKEVSTQDNSESVEDIGEEVVQDSDNEGENGFQCPFCGKLCRCASELKIHKRIHTGEKPFQCLQCIKSFSQLGNLKSHMRSHTGEKPYQCSVCPKNFSELGNLKIHMRSHTGEKPFKCPICPKRFSKKATIIAHKRIHTGEKPYKCVICSQSFRFSSNLAKHKRKGCSS